MIVMGKACKTNAQCTGGQKCIKNECRLPDDPSALLLEDPLQGKNCKNDGMCDRGQKCIKGQCQLPDMIVTGKACKTNAQCTGGQKCIKNECRLPDDPSLLEEASTFLQ